MYILPRSLILHIVTKAIFPFSGFGGSLIFTPIIVIINDYFDKRKGTAMAISTLGSGLGTVAIAPLATFLLSYY